jgi:hypothetical protein
MIDLLLICLSVLGIILVLFIGVFILASVYAVYDLDRELTDDLTDE